MLVNVKILTYKKKTEEKKRSVICKMKSIRNQIATDVYHNHQKIRASYIREEDDLNIVNERGRVCMYNIHKVTTRFIFTCTAGFLRATDFELYLRIFCIQFYGKPFSNSLIY